MFRAFFCAGICITINAFQSSRVPIDRKYPTFRLGTLGVHSQPEHSPSQKLAVKPLRPEKKPFRRKSRLSVNTNQFDWLQQATERFVSQTIPGSLTEGKWHEVVSLINAWTAYQKDCSEAPVRMEALLSVLISERNAGNTNVVIAIDLYNKIMDAWACAAIFATVRNPILASQRIHEMLLGLQESYEMAPSARDLKPNTESFHVALHVVCKVEGVLVARRLLAWMEHLYRSGKNLDARPTRSHYMQTLDAYARLNSPQASLLAEAFLRHMKYQNITDAPPLPDTLCYNIVIKSWSRHRRGREAAEHADRILEEMKESSVEHYRPDVVTYGSTCFLFFQASYIPLFPKSLTLFFTFLAVISAWASSGMKAHAINRAEKLLREIEESDYLGTNTVILNSVMSAWVKAKNPAAVDRTEEILRQMELSTHARPDLISYNTYLHALSMHASPKRPDLAYRAELLLQKMEHDFEDGIIPFGPNVFSYNLVLEAICRVPQDSRVVMRAASVLRSLIQKEDVDPDTFSFNQVLSLLSKSSTKASNVEDLFRYMDQSYKNGTHLYARPDDMSFYAVISAYTRSGDRGSAENAERLLNEMKVRAANGEEHLKPTRFCYNAAIDGWAKSGEGTYGARKAETILQEMQDHRDAGDFDLAPNIVTFNAVLSAWARSGTRCCGYQAEKYLNQMWQLYNAGNAKVKPNDFSYNTVINAISKSKHEGKGQKALRILRRMDKLYQAGITEARPNEITYTAVINSCAFPSVPDLRIRRKALDTAMFTLKELQASRYGQPNQVTYGTYIRACSNLLHDDDDMRRIVIKRAFQQCCQDGQVGEMVLNYIPKDMYHELLSKYSSSTRKVSLHDLPVEWRCNVDDRIQWGPKRKVNSRHFVEKPDRGRKYQANRELKP
jgi:hypothetical protein